MTEPTLAEARKRLEDYVRVAGSLGDDNNPVAAIRTLLAALDRAAEALGPFAKEGRIICSMLIFTLAPGSRQAAFTEAAAVHAELTQEGGQPSSIPTTSGVD